MTPEPPNSQLSLLLRVAGQCASVADIVHQANRDRPDDPDLSLEFRRAAPDGDAEDTTLIDPVLHTAGDGDKGAPPQPGVGYAGLSPQRRREFLDWTAAGAAGPAPLAFQQLLCAHLEVRLLEDGDMAATARALLPQLQQHPTWAASLPLARLQMLAFRLARDAAGLAAWMAVAPAPTALAGIALGIQARLGHPLAARQVVTAGRLWSLLPETAPDPPGEVLQLHISSLEIDLGRHLLDYALSRLDPAACAPRPWRSNHRGLRIAFAQPDLQSALTPYLRDLLLAPAAAPPQAHTDPPGNGHSAAGPAHQAPTERGWQLILEFGSSRSEFFDVALRHARQAPGYRQMMDENRQMVHRIQFKRSEMRRFWRLWSYVQGWASTRVYLNGAELEKWKVWPYSQHLR